MNGDYCEAFEKESEMECITSAKLQKIVDVYLATDAHGRRTLEVVAGILDAVEKQTPSPLAGVVLLPCGQA